MLAHVAQETPAVERAALEFVMDGDEELREIERDIAAAEAEGEAGEHLAHLHARYDEIGGYQARARAQTLLAGLGFDEEAQSRPVATFSGGWRMRLEPRARAHVPRRTCCCSTSPPTTSTWTRCCGSRIG